MKKISALNDYEVLLLNSIKNRLLQGIIPWEQKTAEREKYNVMSGQLYEGLNRMLLNDGLNQCNSYISHKQIVKNGIRIKQGQTSIHTFKSDKENRFSCYDRVFTLNQVHLPEQLRIKPISSANCKSITNILTNLCSRYHSLTGNLGVQKLNPHKVRYVLERYITHPDIRSMFQLDEEFLLMANVSEYLLCNHLQLNTCMILNRQKQIRNALYLICNDRIRFMQTLYSSIAITYELISPPDKF